MFKTSLATPNMEVGLDIAQCPACSTTADINMYYDVQGVEYLACPDCDTIYTEQDLGGVLKTENDNADSRNTESNHLIRLTRVLDAHKDFPKTAIDFGCGDGRFAQFLADSLGYCVGIDLHTQVQLPDLKPSQYDVVTMIEVVEHLFNPINILSKLHSKLKDGGILYLETSFSDWVDSTHPYLDPKIGHRTILSQRGLRLAAQSAGFASTEFINRNVAILRR
jgi:SAM-dependent methyltransferase